MYKCFFVDRVWDMGATLQNTFGTTYIFLKEAEACRFNWMVLFIVSPFPFSASLCGNENMPPSY
jgi:hypothetical protein